MTIRQILFSFKGRLNRAPWWITLILTFALFLLVYPLVFALCWAVVSGGHMSMSFKDHWSSESGTGATTFSMPGGAEAALAAEVIVTILFLWPSLAVCIKRLHDLNISGYLMLVPNLLWGAAIAASYAGQATAMGSHLQSAQMIVGLVILIGLGFFRGTRGPNRHGPDPLASSREPQLGGSPA